MSSLQLSELEYDFAESKPRARFEFAGTIPFVLIHLAALVGGILVEWTAEAIGVAVVSYWARMFGVTAGYHRYFSHRTFKLSRLGQFLMAVLASLQHRESSLVGSASSSPSQALMRLTMFIHQFNAAFGIRTSVGFSQITRRHTLSVSKTLLVSRNWFGLTAITIYLQLP